MATTLIEFKDGPLVEVEVDEDEEVEIAGGSIKKVESTFDKIRPILIKTIRPISSAWEELNKDLTIGQVEVQLGLSFEGEGNLFITKSKATANLMVKLILKPKEQG